LLVRSWLRPTVHFVVFYGLFELAWFLAAVPLVALAWPLPPLARAVLATTLVHVAARAFPPMSTMARYPFYALRCGRLPVVATASTPTGPGPARLRRHPLRRPPLPHPEDAAAAGFHPLHE
jgi:hypothetical protein